MFFRVDKLERLKIGEVGKTGSKNLDFRLAMERFMIHVVKKERLISASYHIFEEHSLAYHRRRKTDNQGSRSVCAAV